MSAQDGGQAFPILESSTKIDTYETAHTMIGGMSLRDYFAAHAPFNPHDWFKPKMQTQRPTPIYEEHSGREFTKNLNELYDYDVEVSRQKYIQWPYAWADAMIVQRKKICE
jgi:hypothetical protein